MQISLVRLLVSHNTKTWIQNYLRGNYLALMANIYCVFQKILFSLQIIICIFLSALKMEFIQNFLKNQTLSL